MDDGDDDVLVVANNRRRVALTQRYHSFLDLHIHLPRTLTWLTFFPYLSLFFHQTSASFLKAQPTKPLGIYLEFIQFFASDPPHFHARHSSPSHETQCKGSSEA